MPRSPREAAELADTDRVNLSEALNEAELIAFDEFYLNYDG